MDLHLICHTKRRLASAGEGVVSAAKRLEKVRWVQILSVITNLRWPNTVFAHDHFVHSTPALSALFFTTIEHSVLMALVIYYKDMLEKVAKQRT